MEFIDLHKQYRALQENIDARIKGVLERGQYIGGEEVRELSERLAAYCGTQYCLTCANGTDALTLALRCFNVKKGDAVFVPDFTFFASAETVALEGATCVFVDVEERTFNLDARKLEDAICEVIRQRELTPKAIVAVDLFGLPANYPKIRAVAKKYNLPIIEDGAQGFGGSIGMQKACSFGDISTTSFFPAKPLGCYGDGGAIFTDNKAYYDLMCSLAVHGKGTFKYDNVRIGYNSRLDTVQAGILLEKLSAFERYELQDRNMVAERYTKALRNRYKTPQIPDGFGSSWAQYTLILKDKNERASLQEYLKAKGIPTMVYYPKPMHAQTAFAELPSRKEKLTISSHLSDCVLSIPMHPYLTETEINSVCNALLEYNQ
ncbi:MAG: DegT/DnrJ/EryC1/StrS aminotransferase family protein [Clostridia bacterium]|nr:DegT/DnrJ/EryC1/StrS aminotransferase family protein [Clostridia bacterium]